MNEFSFRTREAALARFDSEEFDILVVGGGITGAGVARDAASRGFKVGLVERDDFATGTSSRSSKLIHGGLRYLENFELGLVFEALSERALLLKTVPHMVKPLPFYLPVYHGDSNGRVMLSLGLWLYDLLAILRTPKFHRGLSRDRMLKEIPFLKPEGLKGGFQYYDASMFDDVLTVQTLQSAAGMGAAIVNYVSAEAPLWDEERLAGFRVLDRETGSRHEVFAKKVILCGGPWTDDLGQMVSSEWKPWMGPSKGVHLLFDLRRIPVPGALVMNHPEDGRIAFVIPRPEMGSGVVIVGTTDGPAPVRAEDASIEDTDVDYLMKLLNRYFPSLNLKTSDILSGYVGVRPLLRPGAGATSNDAQALQKVSREHHIGTGPGDSVFVAGGKYTTHRKMAEEVVDFAIKTWRRPEKQGKAPPLPQFGPSRTREPVNPSVLESEISQAKKQADEKGMALPTNLLDRYGAHALEIAQNRRETSVKDPEGFPYLASQLKYAMRYEMVIHLEDFYLRRIPLYATRADHGLPWCESLGQVWAQERGASREQLDFEVSRLKSELGKRSEWERRVVKRTGL